MDSLVKSVTLSLAELPDFPLSSAEAEETLGSRYAVSLSPAGLAVTISWPKRPHWHAPDPPRRDQSPSASACASIHATVPAHHADGARHRSQTPLAAHAQFRGSNERTRPRRLGAGPAAAGLHVGAWLDVRGAGLGFAGEGYAGGRNPVCVSWARPGGTDVGVALRALWAWPGSADGGGAARLGG